MIPLAVGLAATCTFVIAQDDPRDVSLTKIEITQGLQRDANDIPLVQGKPTAIRAFPNLVGGETSVAGVSARLHAVRNGAELNSSPIDPDNGPITVKESFSRLDPDDSLNFTLDPDWYAHDTDFWVELVLPDSITDPNPANNRFPAGPGATFPVRYRARRGLSIGFIRVRFTHPDWNGPRVPRAHVADAETCDWARAIFPVDPVAMPYVPWSPGEVAFGQSERGDSKHRIDGDTLITELNGLYLANPMPLDRLFGWTPELSFSGNGLSDPIWAGGNGHVAFGNDTEGDNPATSRYRRTFAHELGHNTDTNGLFHEGPGGRALKSDEIGFDVTGVDHFARIVMRHFPPMSLTPNADLLDVMVPDQVEPHAWITPPHYLHIFNALAPNNMYASTNGDADSERAPAAGQPRELVVVRGQVGRDGSGKFFPFYRIPATPENARRAALLPQEGTHRIRFYDGAGQVLKQIAWTPDFRDDDSPDQLRSRPFTWFLEPIEGVLRVVLSRGDEVLDTLLVAATGPTIEKLKQEVITAGDNETPVSVRLTWDATGDERKPLLHQVYYTNDGGKTWRLVATGLADDEANIRLQDLPGGSQCRFQIRTTDGYNVTVKTTEPLDIQDKAPLAEINTPRTGAKYRQGSGVLLIGRGYDREEGLLPDDRLSWKSDVQGELGSGRKLVVRDLQLGKHRITLLARDSKGNEGISEAVEIVVERR